MTSRIFIAVLLQQQHNRDAHHNRLSMPLFFLTYVIVTLRDSVRNPGYADRDSRHFFRRDTDIAARDADFSDDEVQLLRFRMSDTYHVYIKTHSAYILAASRYLQQSHAAPS